MKTSSKIKGGGQECPLHTREIVLMVDSFAVA